MSDEHTSKELDQCDYRKSDCAAYGQTISGRWICNNHICERLKQCWLNSRASVVAQQGDSEAKAKEILEEYKQRVMQLPSGDAVPCAKWLETRLRIALDLWGSPSLKVEEVAAGEQEIDTRRPMYTHVMTNSDQEKADAVKNEILDLCLHRKVNALVALSAVRCAAECFEEIIREQGGEVFTVNPAATPVPLSDAVRKAAEAVSAAITANLPEDNVDAIAAIISRYLPVQPVEEHRWKSISGVLENHPLRDEYAATIGAATADNDGEFAFDQSCYYCRNKCCHSAQAHAAAVSEHC